MIDFLDRHFFKLLFLLVIVYAIPMEHLQTMGALVLGAVIVGIAGIINFIGKICLLYTSPSPRDS